MYPHLTGAQRFGRSIFRGFSPRAALHSGSSKSVFVAGRSMGTVNPLQRFQLATAYRSFAVKDVLFPLAIFITLHVAFIGAALTFYIH
jgi:hypothetical protein